jgi:MFS family permease
MATADAAGRTPWPQAAVFSILFFFAGLGGMLGPWLVGIGAEFAGIQGGFLLNLLFCLLMLVVLLFLKPQAGKS